MALKLLYGGAFSMLALGACGTEDGAVSTDDQADAIIAASVVPADGQCTHVTVTRLSDFRVSQYIGMLNGAVFKVAAGESHVVATAYAPPCTNEPADPPWIADEQIVTFDRGANTLSLSFHANSTVTIDPTFDNDHLIAVQPGTLVRTGRNGEGASMPNYSLDGWEIKTVTLPPPGGGGTTTETVLFSMEGKGVPYTPRDITGTFDGRFMAQVSETFQPLWVFDGGGNLLETDAVVYPSGTIQWDITDGLEAIDSTHYVRTGYLNNPINCDASGDNCRQSGLDLLEIQTRADGSHAAVVTGQIFLPELPGMPLNTEYPVGVAPVGSNFVVTTLPAGGTRMVVIDGTGALVAGPTMIAGDIEGVFQTFDGRIAALEYAGAVSMYNLDTSARAGETGNLPNGIGFTLPGRVAWNPNANQFIALSGLDNHLASAPADFSSTTPIGIDLSGYALVTAIDVRASANQLMIVDRLPPVDPATSTRIPRVDFYDLATNTQVQHVLLNGVSTGQVRPDSAAFVGPRQQIVSHYRRPGGVADASLDAVVYTHNLDGSLAGTFDLRPLGFPKVNGVMYLATTDEIMMSATDITGRLRLVVVSPSGQPRRSYRTDPISGFNGIAQITSGPFAGDFGVVVSQPSEYVRVQLQ